MARTTFDPAIALTYPAALSHDLANETLVARHRIPDNTAQYPSAFAHSTVLDLANFALLHLQAGHFGDAQLLPPERIAAMHTPQADCGPDPDSGGPTSYGLTFFLTAILGRRGVGHPGGIGTIGSQFLLLPDDGLAVILLFNRSDDFAPHVAALVDATLGALLSDEG